MKKKMILIGVTTLLLLSAWIVADAFRPNAKNEIARRSFRYGRPVVRQYYRGPAFYGPPRVYRGPSFYRDYDRRPYYNRGIYVRPGRVSVGPVDVVY